ncbi:unnamed protein product [Brassica oleracea]
MFPLSWTFFTFLKWSALLFEREKERRLASHRSTLREVKQRFDMARKEIESMKYHLAAINRRQSRLRKRQHRLRNVKRGGELTCSSTKLQSNICCKRFQAPLMHATVDVHRLNTFEHLFKTGLITGEPDTSSQELFQFRNSEQLLGLANTNTSSMSLSQTLLLSLAI